MTDWSNPLVQWASVTKAICNVMRKSKTKVLSHKRVKSQLISTFRTLTVETKMLYSKMYLLFLNYFVCLYVNAQMQHLLCFKREV